MLTTKTEEMTHVWYIFHLLVPIIKYHFVNTYISILIRIRSASANSFNESCENPSGSFCFGSTTVTPLCAWRRTAQCIARAMREWLCAAHARSNKPLSVIRSGTVDKPRQRSSAQQYDAAGLPSPFGRTSPTNSNAFDLVSHDSFPALFQAASETMAMMPALVSPFLRQTNRPAFCSERHLPWRSGSALTRWHGDALSFLLGAHALVLLQLTQFIGQGVSLTFHLLCQRTSLARAASSSFSP